MSTYMKRSIAQIILFSGLIQSCHSPDISVPAIPATQEQVLSALSDVVKRFSKAQTQYDRAALVRGLLELATLHQEQGKALGDLRCYTDAATCYQHVLSLCSDEPASAYGKDQVEVAYNSLSEIQSLLVNRGAMHVPQLREQIARDKQELQVLRKDAKARADDLEALLNQRSTPAEERANEATYIQRSQELFHDIAEGMKVFLARLYLDSEQELGPVPCKYTVMGLGAMALQQMTPYSDLAFAILIDACSDAVAASAYFKQLTHLVNCRVINLGETIIPEDKYGIDLEHLTKRGVHLDLGGKTPLGGPDKSYTLIQTVAGMLNYLKNEGDKVAHTDQHLPSILESTCYVYGDEGLYKSYETQKVEFLAAPPVYKSRAIKRMLEGAVAWSYPHTDVVGPNQQPGDVEVFGPQSGMEDQGKSYDVEKEIYRLPDRLLYGLALYHGIVPGSGWDAVVQLFERGVICSEAVHHLGYIMSFANMLRLRAYLHYDQQYEYVTMLGGFSQEKAQGEVRKALCLPQEALKTDGSLFRYYYTAIPLHRSVYSFLGKLDVHGQWVRAYVEKSLDVHRLLDEWLAEHALSATARGSFFLEDSFHDASAQVKSDVHLRLLQRKEATVYLEEALAIKRELCGPKHLSIGVMLNSLGNIHRDLGDSKQSLVYYTEALAISEEVYGARHAYVAVMLNNIGIAHRDLKDYVQSLAYYTAALEIKREVYGPRHSSIAATLNNLGIVHTDLEDYVQGLAYYREALEMMQEVCGTKQHPHVASTFHNLGAVHSVLGDHDQSLAHYREALGIK